MLWNTSQSLFDVRWIWVGTGASRHEVETVFWKVSRYEVGNQGDFVCQNIPNKRMRILGIKTSSMAFALVSLGETAPSRCSQCPDTSQLTSDHRGWYQSAHTAIWTPFIQPPKFVAAQLITTPYLLPSPPAVPHHEGIPAGRSFWSCCVRRSVSRRSRW